MYALYIILAVLLLIFLVYAVLVIPSSGAKANKFKGVRFAHRGLYGGNVKENTAQAFRAAVSAGYGIELDVQLSNDGVPVVAHDYDLKRVFGIEGRVDSFSAAELAGFGVPRFSEALEIIGGKVPLLAEMKAERTDVSVCEKAAELLDSYKGEFLVESFNPLALLWFKKNRPDYIRGQLSSDFRRDKEKGNPLLMFALRHLLFNFLTRPDFIAYNRKYPRAASLSFCRALGVPLFAWTVRSEEELEACGKYFDAVIFENFCP